MTRLDEKRWGVAICPEGFELWAWDAAPGIWNHDLKMLVPYCPHHKVECESYRVKIDAG